MTKKTIAIVAGTLARGEQLRTELGMDAHVWSTHGSPPGRGFSGIKILLVDGSASWSQEVQDVLRPHNAKIYWIEPVERV